MEDSLRDVKRPNKVVATKKEGGNREALVKSIFLGVVVVIKGSGRPLVNSPPVLLSDRSSILAFLL